ncbi:MAG: peptidoglycan-binding protein [Bifidobacteriaceae bacterium]|nr:peptidoglycan-binding protein [Bifidobacteriaceae bacterium]
MLIAGLAFGVAALGGAPGGAMPAADAASYPYCTNGIHVQTQTAKWTMPASANQSIACIMSTAQSGASYMSVMVIQNAMNARFKAGLTKDGYYGSKTADAVAYHIQRPANLTQDGTYGPDTCKNTWFPTQSPKGKWARMSSCV